MLRIISLISNSQVVFDEIFYCRLSIGVGQKQFVRMCADLLQDAISTVLGHDVRFSVCERKQEISILTAGLLAYATPSPMSMPHGQLTKIYT